MCGRRPRVDLLAQLAHEDVDGAVAVRGPATPDPLQQLVAGEHAAHVERERVEQPELGRREVGARAVDVRLHVPRVEAQLLDHDLVAAARVLRPRATAGGRTDPGRELLHRERLHEVVVGADLERMHAIVLGAARGDDDDRRADPLAARLLDHLPAVEAGEHQVEHAHVGALEAQACQPGLAVRHADRVEAGRLQVSRHALGDDVVVLDDQDLRHCPVDVNGPRSPGGRQVVTDW